MTAKRRGIFYYPFLILKGFGYFILTAALLILLPYLFSAVYDFPQIKPFSGDKLYNPYADTSGTWLKANMQAHSGAWGGITNGEKTEKELHDIYADLGFDVVGITNYMEIAPPVYPDQIYIPMYEHGYNVWKRHRLVIGAEKVIWTDYVLFQSLHHKQHMFKITRPTTKLLAVSHPEFMKGFVPEDFKYLTDYDFLEVLNHYRRSFHHWDAALTAGYPAWGMGDDDSHNQDVEEETGRYWNMVRSPERSGDAVLDAMLDGNTYCVAGWRGENEILLESVSVDSMTIAVETDIPFEKLYFIGDGGEVRDSVLNADSAAYTFTEADTYIRTEIVKGRNEVFLNPALRWNGEALPLYTAEVNHLGTWLYRLLVLLGYLAVLTLIFRRKLFRKSAEASRIQEKS